MIYFIIGFLSSVIWIAYEMWTAPLGEETEQGFKVIKPGKKIKDIFNLQSYNDDQWYLENLPFRLADSYLSESNVDRKSIYYFLKFLKYFGLSSAFERMPSTLLTFLS